jgi:hypothetical protein
VKKSLKNLNPFNTPLSNRKAINILIYSSLLIFFINQLSYIHTAGTTYDADGLRFGANIVAQKIQRILSLNADFSDLPVSDVEFYGMFVILPAYLFSHFLKQFVNDPSNLGFENVDGVIYFFMNVYLTVYVVICLLYIIRKLNNRNSSFSIIFMLILLLTPSFSGHSQFNIKDIPFAFQLFLFALLLIEYLELKIKDKIVNLNLKLGFLMGLVLAVRFNALFFISLLICIVLTFLKLKNKLDFKSALKDFSTVYIFAFFILYLLTPSAWVAPIEWIQDAIYQQFFLEWSGSTLTNGEFIVATEMKWYYLFTWFFHKLPLTFHLSVLIFIYLKYKKIKFDLLFDVASLFVLFVFIIFSIARPSVYDGLRQFLFLIPFLTIFSTGVFLKFIEYKNISLLIFFMPIFTYLLFTQYGLGPYKYVYFNELVDTNEISVDCNNVDGCGNWPTDYWGYSGKEVAEFLNENLLAGEIPKKSTFAWKNNSTSLLICRPSMTSYTYLNKDLNYNSLNVGDFSRTEILTLTYHRPRFKDDSCKFLVNNIDYQCKTIYTFTKNLRFNEIVLAHIKECRV